MDSDAAMTAVGGTMKGGSVSAAVIEAVDVDAVGGANWDVRGGCAPWAAATRDDGGPMSCGRLTGWGRRGVDTGGSAMRREGAREGTEGHRRTLL